MARYGLRGVVENKAGQYSNLFKRRGLKKITHYAAPKFYHLTDEQLQNIRVEPVIWRLGSRFYKIADEEYGDPNLWWIIAFYNRKPTDFHVKLGELIFVPLDWQLVYNAVVENDDKYT
tara:strand:- start:380 stop:733 length:354 start_codon:yes stop_codon:yes gene_type:complete